MTVKREVLFCPKCGTECGTTEVCRKCGNPPGPRR